jgi:RecA-family ATPase
LARICAWVGVHIDDLHGWLRVIDASDNDCELLTETRDGAIITHVYEWLRSMVGDAQVIVLDGASDLFGANENSRREVRKFVRALRRLIPPEGAVLLLAHVDKPTAKSAETSQGYSGSTAWNNSVRARWYLRPEDEGDGLVLALQKANYGPTGAEIRLRWNPEAHVFVADDAAQATRTDRALQESDERDALLRVIAEADAAGDPVPSATTGRRTAWHVIAARDPRFAGKRGKARCWHLIEHLRAAGHIRPETIRSACRHSREVLRAA